MRSKLSVFRWGCSHTVFMFATIVCSGRFRNHVDGRRFGPLGNQPTRRRPTHRGPYYHQGPPFAPVAPLHFLAAGLDTGAHPPCGGSLLLLNSQFLVSHSWLSFEITTLLDRQGRAFPVELFISSIDQSVAMWSRRGLPQRRLFAGEFFFLSHQRLDLAVSERESLAFLPLTSWSLVSNFGRRILARN